MRISARFLLIFVFLASFFIFRFGQAFAAEKTPEAIPQVSNAFNTASNVDKNLHNTTQVVMIETLSALVCQLTGNDIVNTNQKCLGVDPETKKIGFVDNGGGMISVMGNLIGYTFIPPASSTQYIAYLGNNFGLVKPSYAAADPCPGIGFCALNPILRLWVVMRNFAYLIFILIFVLIGLGVMLRVHIDPRTVMTVQNQIPKIIVGLVLVTFSFAISGFLIDVMYTASYLLGSVVNSAVADPAHSQDYIKIINSTDVFDAASKAYDNGGLGGIVTDGSTNFSNLITNVFFGPGQDPSKCAQAGANGATPSELDKFCSVDFIGGILRGLMGAIIGILAYLIIAIAVIYTLIKLFIIMILTYINILLDIVFAPFWFLLGLLPGSSAGVGGWFRDIIANLAVYPATITMLMLANVFANIFRGLNNNGSTPTQTLFVPPVLGNPQDAGALSGVIALGFFFLLPNVLQIMKTALKAPKIDLGPVFKPASEAAGTVGAVISGGVTARTSALPKHAGDPGGFTAVLRKAVRA